MTLPLTADKPSGQITDNPTVTIPLKKGENGDFYQIYVFIEVTRERTRLQPPQPAAMIARCAQQYRPLAAPILGSGDG